MQTRSLKNTLPWRPLLIASPMLALLSARALAQSAAPDPVEPAQTTAVAELRTVEVKAHYDNGVGSSDAASQGVVDGARLTDLPLLRPGEVLETVPGLVVTQHSGDGKANQYFLRGYNLDHGTDLATFLDGVPLNMPTNAHGQGYTDLNLMIPELVETISYTKGPYYAEVGDFGSAGSAQIRYRDSLDKGMLNLTVGAYDYRRLLIANSLRLRSSGEAAASDRQGLIPGGPRLLYALELQKANGPWALPEDLRKINGLLRLSDGSRAQGWSVDAIAYSAHWNSTDQVPLALIQSGQLCRFCALDPTDGGNTHREILSGEWQSHEGDRYTKLSAYVQHYHLQLWSDFRFYEDNPVNMDQFSQWENRNMLGGQAVQGWMHTLGGHESMTEVGLQLRHDNLHVGLLNTQARVTLSTVDNNQVGETLLGVYGQNTTWWNSWFRSLIGLRVDQVNMNLTSFVLPQNNGSASAAKLQPKMSLIFGPWARTEFFINAGRGFHSNDARGVIDKVDPTSLSVAGSSGSPTPAQPVPALVGSRGAELGVRSEWVPGLQSSMALWRLDSDSELVYSADADIGSTSPNGASHRYGLEWNNSWLAAPWLLLDANMAWTHARYAHMNDNGALGDFIPNAVSRVATFGATAHEGQWSGGVNWRYIGPYPLTQDGSQVAPSAIVTNLKLKRQISAGVALNVDVLNLFNRQYYDIAYNQDYQTSPDINTLNSNGITVHPGEPRQLRVSLNVSF